MGEITELEAKIMEESIYALCDVDGNEFILLEAFIDHRKNDSALSAEDQKVVMKERETL